MHIGTHAQTQPHAPAIIMGRSGQVVTYGELDRDSKRIAAWLQAQGLRPGDGIAMLLENRAEVFKVAWAAERSGLFYTPLNTRLTVEEARYIVEDAAASVLFTSRAQEPVARGMVDRVKGLTAAVMLDGEAPGFVPYEQVLTGAEPDRLSATELRGELLMYSSGTTGRPKAIVRGLSGEPVETPPPILALIHGLFGFDGETVYLSPAPLYHTAPIAYCMAVTRFGGTAVVLEDFDPELTLRLIEQHRVTHAQFVPTMFIRLLRLDDATRGRYDLSSLRLVLHGAAPCPVEVKERMLEWWGTIIHEFYAGTEGNGFVLIGPEEWREHKGSVGRPVMGEVHILDEEGAELGPGEVGTVYFSDGPQFEYLNDPEKTRRAYTFQGWSTLGDLGWVDEDGYLYLADRRAHLILSGGVNIYPAEIEGAMIMHEAVADVAVFGVPNQEFGEEVKAVVQPTDPTRAGEALADELHAFCRQRLASYKRPRSIEFQRQLPRDATGKLYKRELQERYWPAPAAADRPGRDRGRIGVAGRRRDG